MGRINIGIHLALVGCLSWTTSAGAADCCSVGCDELDLIPTCEVGCDDFCDGCDVGCDACGYGPSLPGCLGDTCLNDIIKPSDRCFDDFISPTSNFVFFEDPRNLTELRPIFVNHWVPESLGGGTIQAVALQFRIALTDRLSLIATKDGYLWDNSDGVLDTLLADGFLDVAAGLKYNLIRDTQNGTLLSTGFTYEIPIGEDDALQGLGDGEFHLFVTGGQRFLDGNAHWISAFGWRLPVDSEFNNESVHWSNHFDVRITEKLYAFTEVIWWHWTDEADTAFLPVGGQDIFDLPGLVDGNDLVYQSVGTKLKPRRNVEAGIAYEFPLTEYEDVLEGRITTDLIVRY